MYDNAFNIVKNPKYDGYQLWVASMVYRFFHKKTSGGAAMLTNKAAVKKENTSNKELAEELHKLIIRICKKRKMRSSFIDNIWGADLADVQLIRKFDKKFIFYYMLWIFSLNICIVSQKDKKGILITNASQKILDWSYDKPSKTWVDKGSKFYDRSMKS